MPISVDFKGSNEEMAHRAWLILFSERIFGGQGWLFLFLTQLEYLQKMFTLVKEHCWATPWFFWLTACSLSVISTSMCQCTFILQHSGQRLLKLCGASVLACYQLHLPFSHTIYLPLATPHRVHSKSHYQSKVNLWCIQAFSKYVLLLIWRMMHVCVLTHSEISARKYLGLSSEL